jgi:hypothetical protein
VKPKDKLRIVDHICVPMADSGGGQTVVLQTDMVLLTVVSDSSRSCWFHRIRFGRELQFLLPPPSLGVQVNVQANIFLAQIIYSEDDVNLGCCFSFGQSRCSHLFIPRISASKLKSVQGLVLDLLFDIGNRSRRIVCCNASLLSSHRGDTSGELVAISQKANNLCQSESG